jgi:hypothetical protein
MFCLAGGWSPIPAFPLMRNVLLRTARSRQGRADRRGLRNLDGEDRSELIEEEGKQILDSGSISETRASKTGCAVHVSTMVLSEARGL